MIFAELLLGFEHAGGGPAQRHVAGLPALHVALVRRTISIIDSHGFVDCERALQRAA